MLFMTPNGFGKGLSTVDAVFILMNVFQTCLSKNNRLYCALSICVNALIHYIEMACG